MDLWLFLCSPASRGLRCGPLSSMLTENSLTSDALSFALSNPPRATPIRITATKTIRASAAMIATTTASSLQPKLSARCTEALSVIFVPCQGFYVLNDPLGWLPRARSSEETEPPCARSLLYRCSERADSCFKRLLSCWLVSFGVQPSTRASYLGLLSLASTFGQTLTVGDGADREQAVGKTVTGPWYGWRWAMTADPHGIAANGVRTVRRTGCSASPSAVGPARSLMRHSRRYACNVI